MKPFNTICAKEVFAANEAIAAAIDNRSPLSGYIGGFALGGPQCIALEKEWCRKFGTTHAVAVNSATSGLLAACMAVGIVPGDEVIVSAYTMSATVAVPKILGAKIVFADIEEKTFGLDPEKVYNLITPKTKAVIVTNLFGHPANLKKLRLMCEVLKVTLIEDNAQGIFAKEHNKYTGTIGHIGVFSLNVHKHLQVGEGGVCVTDNALFGKRLREAMNHGELRNGIIGLNLRMTEMTAAMARVQLEKADKIMDGRIELAEAISYYVKKKGVPIHPPHERPLCQNAYYCWAGLSHGYVNVTAPFGRGYLRPLYELAAFKQDIRLPVVEDIESRLILLEVCSVSPTDQELIQMVEGLGRKIDAELDELARLHPNSASA